ncbi:hypothetical protein EBU24_00755 [bacterium]|nr:hypothetical protein [bacterium]
MAKNLEPQAPVQDKTKLLYDAVSKDYNIGTYDDFSKKLQDSSKRKAFYDGVGAEYNLGTFDDFSAKIGSADLKKKDQEVSLSVSSPTQSLLPDFEKGKAFAEKGFLMKPEGTKEQKKISIEPSFTSAIFGGAPNVKVLEEGEEPSTLADISNSVIKGQIQGKVANILAAGKKPTENELGELAQLQIDAQLLPQSKSEKLYQEKGLKGLFVDSPTLGVQFVTETMASSLSALFEASQRTVPAAVAMGATAGAPFAGIGALVGAGTGLLAGQSAAGYNLSTSQDILNSLSDNGVDISNKESLIKAFSDEKKMAKIRSTAAKYGIPILAFDAATAGLAGKLAAGAIGKSLSKKLLAGLGETGIQVGGGMGGEFTGQLASGKKVNLDEIIMEGLAEVPGGAVEVVTGVQMERSKTASNNKTLATQIATQGVQNGAEDAVVNLNRDLANNVITPEQYQEGVVFVEKAAQVADKIPEAVTGENKAKSIELLVERNDIKQANDNLIQQKQTTDEAYHAGIDEEVKINEEKIKKIDSEVYNIAKKPVKETRTKKYTVDGEEVSQAEFEAIQGKPIGTKEIIKAEVKPTKVKVTEEVKPTEEINKVNVTVEGTTDGYKVISGDKANSIGDIRQEANEARKNGQDTFTKETIKDGKKIFTLTDTTVLDDFGRQGFKSASISFPEGTKFTMEDVMPKLKSELGIKEEVKPSEVIEPVEEQKPVKKENINIKNIVDEKGNINTYSLKAAIVDAPALINVNEKTIENTVGHLRQIADKVNDKELNDTVTYLEDASNMLLSIKNMEEGKRNEFLSNQENFYSDKKPPSEVLKRLDDWAKVLKGNTAKNNAERLLKEQYQQVLGEIQKRFVDEKQQPNRPKLLEAPVEVKPTEVQEAPKKTYQEALKEKQAAEKKQIRQTAGEKAAVTRKTIEESNKIESSDARSAALKYLTGGKLSWDAINEVAGRVKRATLNTGAREFKSEEVRLRDYVAKKGEGQSLDEAAHSIWDNLSEEMQGKMTTQEVKDALINAISEHPSRVEAAKSLIDGYKEESLEDLESKYYERFGDNAEIEIDKELNQVPNNQLDIEQELINANYESEQQFQDDYWNAKEATNNFTEKAPSTKAQKAETAKSLAEAYKDLTINQKRQIINSKFDELLQELKIEKICPT